MKPDPESHEQKIYKYLCELEISTFGLPVKHPDLTPMFLTKKSVLLRHVCEEEEVELGGERDLWVLCFTELAVEVYG